MNLNLKLRMEKPEDHHAVELLTREAFWGFMSPTCDEHYLVHLLRSSPAFVPELDLVAEYEGELVGNVMYSKATVTDQDGKVHPVLTFGPLSVLPKFWNCGVGSALMRSSIWKAKELGYRGIVLYGHPDYYPRFGFQSAKLFNITGEDGTNRDSLMAMELSHGSLQGITGRFAEDSIFGACEEGAEEYDKQYFPHKEPVQKLSIDVLLSRLPEYARAGFYQRGVKTLAVLNRFSGRELLSWDGIDLEAMQIINAVLQENGIAPKLLPGCEILERAKTGIDCIADKLLNRDAGTEA